MLKNWWENWWDKLCVKVDNKFGEKYVLKNVCNVLFFVSKVVCVKTLANKSLGPQQELEIGLCSRSRYQRGRR